MKALLLDTHVHYYDCYDLDTFLDGAWDNSERGRRQLGAAADSIAAAVLTDLDGENRFHEFRRAAGTVDAGKWRWEETPDPNALLAKTQNGKQLYVIAGRQIVTSEGLEVLALSSQDASPHGKTLPRALEAIVNHGAIAVIPWGFGKWWFKRARVLSDLLRSKEPPPFHLGDNAGRLAYGPVPRLFAEARTRGIWTLPGTDPLPFPSESAKAGKYGCLLKGRVDEISLANSAMAMISSLREQPKVYGTRAGLAAFCQLQVQMQWRKARRKLSS